jgi:hypothetical protein
MNLHSCSCGGKLLVYVTRKLSNHVVRYRRCSHCRCTSKHVQMTTLEIPSESSTQGSPLVLQPFLESWHTSKQTNAQEGN